MTAEQALIKENKKDPRVRYITGGNRMNIVYENKPSFSTTYEHWQCSTGHREVLYYEIDFNGFPTYSDCSLLYFSRHKIYSASFFDCEACMSANFLFSLL